MHLFGAEINITCIEAECLTKPRTFDTGVDDLLWVMGLLTCVAGSFIACFEVDREANAIHRDPSVNAPQIVVRVCGALDDDARDMGGDLLTKYLLLHTSDRHFYLMVKPCSLLVPPRFIVAPAITVDNTVHRAKERHNYVEFNRRVRVKHILDCMIELHEAQFARFDGLFVETFDVMVVTHRFDAMNKLIEVTENSVGIDVTSVIWGNRVTLEQ
jgi:hypothetical protein